MKPEESLASIANVDIVRHVAVDGRSSPLTNITSNLAKAITVKGPVMVNVAGIHSPIQFNRATIFAKVERWSKAAIDAIIRDFIVGVEQPDTYGAEIIFSPRRVYHHMKVVNDVIGY